MEIIQERLEREFDMTVITTVPNVSYHAYTNKNPDEPFIVNNPSDLPDSKLEQFVIEALVIEQQDANAVLAALAKLGVSIKPGVAAQDTDRQQLYYFRRKTLAKIAGLLEENKHA